MLQVISAIIFYTLFLALVIVLFLIWRSGTRSNAAQRVLNDIALKNAEAAHIAAEAAQSLAKRLEKS